MKIIQMAERAQKGFEKAALDQNLKPTEPQWQLLEVLRQSDSKGGAAHALNVSPFTLAEKARRVFDKLGV